METLDDILNLSWAQFDELRAAEEPRAAPLAPDCGRAQDDVVCTVEDEDGETSSHVCGMRCIHLLEDADGSYVCRLTGRVFGRQLCAGPTDSRRLCAYAPPAVRAKRRRTNAWVTTAEEVYGACTRAVVALLGPSHRRQSDAERLGKALKTATRIACARRRHEPCVLRLMCLAFAEVEHSGALVVQRTVTEAQMDALARLMCTLFQTVLAPYALCKTTSRRPTHQYYAYAMLYLLAQPEGPLGRRLHVPLLTSFMPEEKSLKTLNVIVSRVTLAKRYCLAAIQHYIDEAKAKAAAAAASLPCAAAS